MRGWSLRGGIGLAVAASLVVSADGEQPGAWGELRAGLRMAISQSNQAVDRGVPEFDLTIENAGDDDVVINVGFTLANGSVKLPTAVRLRLTEPNGDIRELEYVDRRHARITGRLNDFLIDLRSRSTSSIRLTLDRYWSATTKAWSLPLAPGKYQIEAHLSSQAARFASSDRAGVVLARPWTGSLHSNALAFEVP